MTEQSCESDHWIIKHTFVSFLLPVNVKLSVIQLIASGANNLFSKYQAIGPLLSHQSPCSQPLSKYPN